MKADSSTDGSVHGPEIAFSSNQKHKYSSYNEISRI